MRRTLLRSTLAATVALSTFLAPVGAFAAPQPAPAPTSTEISPGAPDPHPPRGGHAPNGSVPGGGLLASRGILVPSKSPPLPKRIRAASWVLADLDSGEILAARDPHGRYQPASILKTLTAVTVLPHLPGNQVVTVSPAAAHAEGSAVGLLAGGRYTIDQLFHALILVSGNDAAAALAQANGGVAETVKQMNDEAVKLGAYDTFVQTPSGLDGWQQLTSSYDMALVLRAALKDPRFVAYDRARSETYPPQRSKYGHVSRYQFTNEMQNFLDAVPGALVAKTGYTDAARHTYMAAAERNGRRLGVVFLRDERVPADQWQQAASLFTWGFALKSGTAPVGTLAGPIDASAPLTSTSPASSLSPTSTSTTTATATLAVAPQSQHSRAVPAKAWAAGLLLVGGGAFATQRLRRRRAQRQR